MDTLIQEYGIQYHRSSAYMPQTNGAVEVANKNIKRSKKEGRQRGSSHESYGYECCVLLSFILRLSLPLMFAA